MWVGDACIVDQQIQAFGIGIAFAFAALPLIQLLERLCHLPLVTDIGLQRQQFMRRVSASQLIQSLTVKVKRGYRPTVLDQMVDDAAPDTLSASGNKSHFHRGMPFIRMRQKNIIGIAVTSTGIAPTVLP